MDPSTPHLVDVISGIISVAARGGERIFVPQVHAVLSEMKAHDDHLGGLWFTITGSTCYSRDVDNAIRLLAAQGVLVMKGGLTAVVLNAKSLRERLRAVLPAPEYRWIRSASVRFFRALRGRK